jgi:isocitrate dehydrogenase
MTTATASDGKKLVTLIPGDGVGPECIDATKRIIEATGVKIGWELRHAGESVFKQNIASGVPQDTIESIRKTRCVLKGPLGTPVGYGEKSANVTLRKLFETYGNIRPVRELPGVTTPYSGRGIDLVIVRENVEDLYAGIEHLLTPGVAQCLKLISRKGCEKIARLAFEFARSEGRKSVACATKSNIMKMTEGMLKRTFESVAKDYPDIQSWHIIVDNCAHQLVKKPEQFDVIVTTNMNGDILSDLTSALVGGLGFAPSANLGNGIAIFEAVHGSAPKYAGKNVINPTAVLGSGIMLLRYLREFEAANAVENALLVTLEEGKARTGDVVGYDGGKNASTTAYADEIIKNLGRKSGKWKVRDYRPIKMPEITAAPDFVKAPNRRVAGLDVSVESSLLPPELGPMLEKAVAGSAVQLKTIASRGTRVWPPTGTVLDLTDLYSARFIVRDAAKDLDDTDVLDVLKRIAALARISGFVKLQEFDGQPGWTKAQGED